MNDYDYNELLDKNKVLNDFSNKTGLSTTIIEEACIKYLKATNQYDYVSPHGVAMADSPQMALSGINGSVTVAQYCLETNQMYEAASESLSKAKEELRNVSSDDISNYDTMKQFYTSGITLYEFLESPDGNYSQATDTMNSYLNEMKEYKNLLEFDYGE